MAIPSSGTVSTTTLETEYAGVTPFTKTMENFMLMANSTTRSTSTFYSKSAPTIGTPYLESFVNSNSPDVVTIRSGINGQGIVPCRFRIVGANSSDFVSNFTTGSWLGYSGAYYVEHIFNWYFGSLKYYRGEIQFGASYAYSKYSDTFTHTN